MPTLMQHGSGGDVVMGAHDVMDLGRMAVLRDTIGATFSVWQSRKHHGIDLLGEPGSLGWTQLNASDPGKTKRFHTGLFGWKAEDMPNPGGGSYTTGQKRDGGADGMMSMPPNAGAPSHGLAYWMFALMSLLKA